MVFATILCITMVLSCIDALDLVGKRVVATYVLEAQSDEYNIVPEFSSPILLPLPVLVIALPLVFSRERSYPLNTRSISTGTLKPQRRIL